MNLKLLRRWINLIVEEVIGEPDLTNQESREKDSKKDDKIDDKNALEASVAAAVPGTATPLGTGPNYPSKIVKKAKKKRKRK